jgi:hypothetical protein
MTNPHLYTICQKFNGPQVKLKRSVFTEKNTMSSADNLSHYFSKRINLLVVEDDENLLSALVEIFSIPCFNVTSASSIEEARNAAQYRKFGRSLPVCLDMVIPGHV